MPLSFDQPDKFQGYVPTLEDRANNVCLAIRQMDTRPLSDDEPDMYADQCIEIQDAARAIEKDGNDEDFRVAQMFHHGGTNIKIAVLCLLRLFYRTPASAVLISILCFGCQSTESGGLTGKNAQQSSDYGNDTRADKAVDGNTDGNYAISSVAITALDRNAWWQIDLGSSSEISSIEVWNRTDCCPERLADYWVFVSDTPFAPGDTPSTLPTRQGTWSNHQTTAPIPSTTIPVNAKGRYVRVQLAGENFLSLAEVKVHGKS